MEQPYEVIVGDPPICRFHQSERARVRDEVVAHCAAGV